MTETLYKTKIPKPTVWWQEFFELTMGEQTVNGQLGYFVRETQCWWDCVANRTVRVQYTLSPHGGFVTIEEAYARYQLQRTHRARRGFVHSFTPRYESTQKHRYVLIKIAPQPAEEPGTTQKAETHG
jgi:hypothetical protein